MSCGLGVLNDATRKATRRGSSRSNSPRRTIRCSFASVSITEASTRFSTWNSYGWGYIASRMDDASVVRHFEASFLGNAASRDSSMDLRIVGQIPKEPVLGAGQGVWVHLEWHDPGWRTIAADPQRELQRLDYGITIGFLDTHGRRWRRTNTAPPMRRLPPPKRRWWNTWPIYVFGPLWPDSFRYAEDPRPRGILSRDDYLDP
jgi:hypothetical protein